MLVRVPLDVQTAHTPTPSTLRFLKRKKAGFVRSAIEGSRLGATDVHAAHGRVGAGLTGVRFPEALDARGVEWGKSSF